MPRTTFQPALHGFHFANEFANHVLGGWTTYGRCGGMAYTALDYYFAKLPIPTHVPTDFPGGEVPPDGSALADGIYQRLLSSWSDSPLQWLAVPLDSDATLAQRIWDSEIPKLREAIRTGRPVPLGLYEGHAPADGSDHQLICYGYDELAGGGVKLWLYDNNYPDVEVPLVVPPGSNALVENCPDGDQKWIGFFVKDTYQPAAPQYRDLVLDPAGAVKNVGAFTAHGAALQIDIDDDLPEVPFDLAPGQARPLPRPSTSAWYKSRQGHWVRLQAGGPSPVVDTSGLIA
jgi:hypothetical protein